MAGAKTRPSPRQHVQPLTLALFIKLIEGLLQPCDARFITGLGLATDDLLMILDTCGETGLGNFESGMIWQWTDAANQLSAPATQHSLVPRTTPDC